MLTMWGEGHRYCDSLSRRDFLSVGALGLGGLTLADLLRLRAVGGNARKARSVILVCLGGGPSHIDTYDLKPAAPVEVRGEFKPIQSKVSGFDLCEHLPLQAAIADKLALIRTVQFVEPMQHHLEEIFTGLPASAHRPAFGAVVSRFRPGDLRMPSYISLDNSGSVEHEGPQYLGAAHAPFRVANATGVRNLSLSPAMSSRLGERRQLLRAFDTYRRDLDTHNQSRDMDEYTARAFDIITSPKTRDAFDLDLEPPAVRRRYGNPDDRFAYLGKKLNTRWEGEQFLLARRLVEAGVGVVTLRAGRWDHHGNVIQGAGGISIFHNLRSELPLLDRSIHALVSDLHERGLDREVCVLVWGEFGRTPKISLAGRDHWPETGFALFAGGGLKTGQVVGETDSIGARPKSRGVSPQNVLATLYTALGIDPALQLPDFSGRPTYLLEEREPIGELL